MNWTFNILKRTKTDDDTLEIIVEFDNGNNNFKRIFYATKENLSRTWLESQITKEVKVFEDAISFIADIKTGAFVLTANTPQSPTAEQVKRDEYNNKLRKLTQMNELVVLGVIAKEDTQALVDEVKTLATQLGEI